MEFVLQGIPNVVYYIDDILITGKSDDEHLKNLTEVCERLQKCGIRVKHLNIGFCSHLWNIWAILWIMKVCMQPPVKSGPPLRPQFP